MALRVEARELHRRGFRAISLSAATPGAALVCRVFKRAGFRVVLVDVPDPHHRRSLRRAVRMRRCADGFVIGHGGWAAGRYTLLWLETVMAEVRSATGRPVTTREPLVRYEENPELLQLGDWVFPSANPYAADARLPQTACGYSVNRYLGLVALVPPGRSVIMGETGLPTAGGRGLNENGQRAFFGCIEPRTTRFEHHSAFDRADDTSTSEAAHYGVFRADGTPKAWAVALARPRLRMRRTDGAVQGVTNAPPEYFRVALYAHAAEWRPVGVVEIGRGGKWRARGTAAAALLVARGFVPGAPAARLPQVDDATVFAVAEAAIPPRGR